MISSEVQRTLVKSPPELWNELSDPESLARHLGELGEIAITRVEPENLVEWEAEGTTGTVQIKPAGWGTRVTLTVSRELPAAETGSEAEQDLELRAQSEPGVAADANARADTETPPDTALVVDSEPVVEIEPMADSEPESPGEPVDDTEPVVSRDREAEHARSAEPQRGPGPATEAARRAAGWPSTIDEPDTAIESEPPAAAVADDPSEPDGLDAWAAQVAIEPPESVDRDEPDASTEPAETDEPRRGFFARLFGRRRRQDTPARTAPTESLARAGEAEDLPEPPAGAEEQQDAALDAIADFAITGEDLDPADDALDELEPADEPAMDAGEGPGLIGAEADAAAPAETPDLIGDEPGQELAPTGAADGNAAAPDLSAELKAAEEVAAEPLTAVLTAVLDRLGAAHHRPFTRP